MTAKVGHLEASRLSGRLDGPCGLTEGCPDVLAVPSGPEGAEVREGRSSTM